MRINLLLAFAFVLLTAGSLYKCTSQNAGFVDLATSPRMFDGFVADNVAILQVTRRKEGAQEGSPDAQEGFALRKADGRWIFADQGNPWFGVAVRQADVKGQILDKIGKVKLTGSNVIVANADEQELEKRGLDEAGGLHVVAQNAQQEPLADLWIGEPAGVAQQGTDEAVQGTFLRKGETKAVVLYEEPFSLDLDPKTWIDRNRRDLGDGEITELVVEGRTESGKDVELKFLREEGKGWKPETKPEGTGKLKDFMVQEMESGARTIWASDIVQVLDPQSPDFQRLLLERGFLPKPRMHVVAKTKDGKEHHLYVGKRVEGKQDYYAHLQAERDEPNLLFTVSEWDVNRYEKSLADFFDPPEAKQPDKGGEEGKDGAGGEGAGAGKTPEEQGDGTPSPGKSGDEPGGSEPPAKDPETPTEPGKGQQPSGTQDDPAKGGNG